MLRSIRKESRRWSRCRTRVMHLCIFLAWVVFYNLTVLPPVVWGWSTPGTYVGLGVSSFDMDSEHPSIGTQGGGGYQLIFGRYGAQDLSGEIIMSGGLRFPTGPVPDPYYPEDSAEYGYFMFGGRFHFLDPAEHLISPWLGLGWAWHAITWNTYFYEIDGTSLTPYAGVDFLFGDRKGILRVDLRRHSFNASSGWYGGSHNVRVNEFNLSFGYHFK